MTIMASCTVSRIERRWLSRVLSASSTSFSSPISRKIPLRWRANPSAAPVHASQLERHVETAVGFGDAPDRLLDARAILRFEPRKKQLPGHGLVASDAEEISRHVGPFQFHRGQVEI